MSLVLTPRARVQAIAARRGGRHTLAVPLALRLAARIRERPLEGFFADPTQLANGLSDFLDAVGPDGLTVTDPEVLADEVTAVPPATLALAPRTAAALEVVRRLKATIGESAVIVAVLAGPASAAKLCGDPRTGAEVTEALSKAFLAADADVLIFREPDDEDLTAFEAPLRTITNMARFHRALIYLIGPKLSFMEAPSMMPLGDPRPGDGLVITEGDLPTDTDITLVQDWVTAVNA